MTIRVSPAVLEDERDIVVIHLCAKEIVMKLAKFGFCVVIPSNAEKYAN